MVDNHGDLENWRLVQCKLSRLFVHDLKNPISALSANLNYLETTQLEETEDMRGAVNDSILAANMLLRLADNFDMIALLESGESAPLVGVDMGDFIRASIRRNKGIATSAGIRVLAEEPLQSISHYWQNRYAELVVDNLIMSAVRHSPYNADVTVGLDRNCDEVYITVSDQGQPIDVEYVDGLFTREGQVRAKRSAGCRYGRGLGLYAVGLGLEALGARIEVRTEDGWTRFMFAAPLQESPSDK